MENFSRIMVSNPSTQASVAGTVTGPPFLLLPRKQWKKENCRATVIAVIPAILIPNGMQNHGNLWRQIPVVTEIPSTQKLICSISRVTLFWWTERYRPPAEEKPPEAVTQQETGPMILEIQCHAVPTAIRVDRFDPRYPT